MFGKLLSFFGHSFLLTNYQNKIRPPKSSLSYLPDSVSEHGIEDEIIIRNLFANHSMPSLNYTTKEEAFVRCTYTASVDELRRSYESIPEKFHKLLAEDSEHTKHIAEEFHQTRRDIGYYYKNKTADIYPVSIREIDIRNLMKYRDKLGPSYESLKNGIGNQNDKEATET